MASMNDLWPVTNIPGRPPFDDEDADIIFRSSDDIDFRLYRVILAKASPVFRTMLRLPQPPLPSTPTAPSAPGEPHVVTLSEDAKTLENLLRLCYPVEDPSLTSLDDVHDVLEAARKYEITVVATKLRRDLRCMLPKESLRVYAIAYMMEMGDMAREAANLFLDDPQFHFPPSPPPEFDALPAVAIYTVHAYRQDCAAAVSRVLDTEDWTSQKFVCLSCESGTRPWISEPRSTRVQQWFFVYFYSLKAALKERPSGRTVRTFVTSAGAGEAFSQIAGCSDCLRKANVDLARFSEWLGEKIDDAVAKVRIKFSFSITREEGVASDD